MGITRDSALITGAALVNYTSQTDLANLEVDGEVDLDTVVLEAHRDLYDRLRADYTASQLTALTTSAALERVVAWLTLARLNEVGHLPGGLEAAEVYNGRADDWLKTKWKAEFSDSSDEPRRGGEAIPYGKNPTTLARFRGV